jgi:hypothetical protein
LRPILKAGFKGVLRHFPVHGLHPGLPAQSAPEIPRGGPARGRWRARTAIILAGGRRGSRTNRERSWSPYGPFLVLGMAEQMAMVNLIAGDHQVWRKCGKKSGRIRQNFRGTGAPISVVDRARRVASLRSTRWIVPLDPGGSTAPGGWGAPADARDRERRVSSTDIRAT